jgi:hypothetical protein
MGGGLDHMLSQFRRLDIRIARSTGSLDAIQGMGN